MAICQFFAANLIKYHPICEESVKLQLLEHETKTEMASQATPVERETSQCFESATFPQNWKLVGLHFSKHSRRGRGEGGPSEMQDTRHKSLSR